MRTPRIKLTHCSAVYHCISRTVGGDFMIHELEKEVFRRTAAKLADFCGVQVITYSVMDNHFHLVVRVPAPQPISDQEIARRVRVLYPVEHPLVKAIEQDLHQASKINDVLRQMLLARMGDISMYLKEVKQRFTRMYNRMHERFGTIWAERFKSSLLEDAPETVQPVAAYVDLNAVRAPIVGDPKDYRFCGYAEAVAVDGIARAMLSTILPGETWAEKNQYYRRYLLSLKAADEELGNPLKTREQIKAEVENGVILPLATLLRLRIRYFTDGAVLGSRAFVEEVFQRFRPHFGKRRKDGARPMKGADWGNLMVLRQLRKDVFS